MLIVEQHHTAFRTDVRSVGSGGSKEARIPVIPGIVDTVTNEIAEAHISAPIRLVPRRYFAVAVKALVLLDSGCSAQSQHLRQIMN